MGPFKETEIRTGSLIVEKTHLYLNPNNLHSVENYGIITNIDTILGIEIYWISMNESNFYPRELF